MIAAERYTRAIHSAHLGLAADRRSSADVLIASGWCQSSLGASLYRLRAEFDGARSSAARSNSAAGDRLMVLMNLASLERARRELGQFASVKATRDRYMVNDETVMKIAGRVLDVWLDGSAATGRREVRLWTDDAGHQFGRSLLAEMDRKAQRVADKMRQFLRN